MSFNADDPRWGGYVPWFLRHSDFSGQGDFPTFFSRLSQRVERLVRFNECRIAPIEHFGHWLESESLQRFRFKSGKTLAANLLRYFHPDTLEEEASKRIVLDKEEREATEAATRVHTLNMMLNPPPNIGSFRVSPPRVVDTAKTTKELVSWRSRAKTLKEKADATREQRKFRHYAAVVTERIGVLEALLRILPKRSEWYAALIQDILRFFAESRIVLTIREETGSPPRIVPLDEQLLQEKVIDVLLPRLSEKFRGRAKELLDAYHDMLSGKSGDSIFINAYKSLEQLARDITGDSGFVFDQSHLDRHFPSLHPTTKFTLMRLKGHRDDRAAHGRDSPPSYELRYLLFTICNSALLLLDYPSSIVQG